MGVSVRHNSRLAALVALAAAVMTVAWFSRALQTGAWTDWLWCVVVAGVGLLQLLVVADGRAPLMVADDQGVRVRRGETWSGLRWQDIEHVEVQSPASWLRDGHIVVHPRVVSREEELLRETQANEDGAHEPVPSRTEAYVVPLAHTTKLEFDGLTGDLVSDLDALASGRVPVLVLTRIEPESPEKTPKAPKALKAARQGKVEQSEEFAEPEPGLFAQPEEPMHVVQPEEPVQVEFAEHVEPGQGLEESAPVEKIARVRNARGRWLRMLARLGVVEPARHAAESTAPDVDPDTDQGAGQEVVQDAADEQDEPTFEPVDPSRATRPAARSEVLRDSVRMLPATPAIPSQRSANAPAVVARVDDFVVSEPTPAKDALIGPLIAAARNRARLSIDTLSERTRIRPHVLECIEVDDFEACGGDFYARGHLRTLARVFGLDPQQLLDLYDDHYAKAEIEARQVFEAELATGIGGGVRAAHTGPRWSLLAACVLALAGVWGVARVFNDTPQELVSPTPNVVDAAGLAKADPAETPKMTLATLEVSSEDASPQVVIRDRDGRILWAGKLGEGQRQQVIGLAPFDVTASNGGAVKVSYLNKKKVTVGDSDAAASKQFG
jgi:cytoskeleton protein RodZ